MSRIYSYIRCLENNQPSEGVGRVFGMFAAPSKNKISAIRQGRIQMAKSKIAQCTHLFSCEIICGASRTDDIRSIESIFPYDAFTYNTISCKKARRAMVHRPSLPIFGKTRHPLLSETELTSFVNLPTENDLLRTGLKHGKTTSYTSGSRLPRMDNTVNDD